MLRGTLPFLHVRLTGFSSSPFQSTYFMLSNHLSVMSLELPQLFIYVRLLFFFCCWQRIQSFWCVKLIPSLLGEKCFSHLQIPVIVGCVVFWQSDRVLVWGCRLKMQLHIYMIVPQHYYSKTLGLFSKNTLSWDSIGMSNLHIQSSNYCGLVSSAIHWITDYQGEKSIIGMIICFDEILNQ